MVFLLPYTTGFYTAGCGFSGINCEIRLVNCLEQHLDKAASDEISSCESQHFADHATNSSFSRVAQLVVSAKNCGATEPPPPQSPSRASCTSEKQCVQVLTFLLAQEGCEVKTCSPVLVNNVGI